MKKIILSTILLCFYAVSVDAQKMSMSPVRSAFNVGSDSKIEQVADSEVKNHYPNGISSEKVLVKVSNDKDAWVVVFIATKDEYLFLKKILEAEGIQIVLDDKEFIGFCKIRIY
jgi:hypothetical protein